MTYEFWRRFWNREVQLEEGHYYYLRETGTDTPVIGQFIGWSNDLPSFRFLEDHAPERATVAVLGEARDPFRERDGTDPPLA